MKRDTLSIYTKDLKKYPVITAEEQIELAKDFINNKNKQSFDKLVKANLRYVLKLATKYAKRYKSIGLSLSDFVQAGNIGLIIGLNKYDPDRGTAPVSFAHSYIRTELDKLVGANISCLRRLTTVVDRFMIYRRQKIINIIEAKPEDKQGLREQLSVETKISIKDIMEQEEKYSVKVYSINQIISDENLHTFESLLPSDHDNERSILNDIIANDLITKLDNTFSNMNDRSVEWIKALYIHDKTLQSIGDEYGVSRERVRQVIEKSLNKMYKMMKKEGVELDGYTQVS